MLRFFSVPLMLTISVAIVSLVPVPKEEELFFPTRVGAKWVYQYSDGTELTSVVTKVEVKAGAKVVSVSRVGKDGLLIHCYTKEVSPRGIFVINIGDPPKDIDPPLCDLRLPCKTGEKWKVGPYTDLESPYFGEKYEWMTRGWEEIKVPFGTFKAIRVEENRVFTPRMTWRYTTWHAPGVGVVKLVTDTDDGHNRRIERESVLKSFTPGN